RPVRRTRETASRRPSRPDARGPSPPNPRSRSLRPGRRASSSRDLPRSLADADGGPHPHRALASLPGRGRVKDGLGEGGRRCEKPPEPEGPSGLSSRTLGIALEPVKPRTPVLSLFLDALQAEGAGAQPIGERVHADPRT